MAEYAELIEALRLCQKDDGCESCAYKKDMLQNFCWLEAMSDAADTIEALMKINNRFRELLDNRNKDVAELQRKVDELTTKNEALRGRIEDKELQIDMLTADNTNYDIAIDELKAQLPKRGEWIHIEGDDPWEWTCSACMKNSEIHGEQPDFCPNCGADMRAKMEGCE